MIIEHVKIYNTRMKNKWHKDVEKWSKDKFTHNIMPQLAFYLFWNSKGNEEKTGYVASDEHSAYWAKTKKEAIKRFTNKC